MTRPRKLAAASTDLTLGDLEAQLFEVSEALRLADTHVAIKRYEARTKVLRALVELVIRREEDDLDQATVRELSQINRTRSRSRVGVAREDESPVLPLAEDLDS